MSGPFSRLNPSERRFAIGVGLFVLLIFNYFLVWPHFSDWGVLKTRLNKALDQHRKYEETIQQSSALKPQLEKLKAGGDVQLEDQALQFVRAIQNQANQSGLRVDNYGKQSTSTNSQFFLELTQTISVQSPENPLVDFLFNLGGDGSMIRVRSLNLHPDPPHQQLSGNITLVASYQKKPTTKAASAAASTATPPATKPAAAPKPAPIATKPTPKPGSPVTNKPGIPAPRSPVPQVPPLPKK